MYLHEAQAIKAIKPINPNSVLCILPATEPNQSKAIRRVFIEIKNGKKIEEIDIDKISEEVEKFNFSVHYLSYREKRLLISPSLLK